MEGLERVSGFTGKSIRKCKRNRCLRILMFDSLDCYVVIFLISCMVALFAVSNGIRVDLLNDDAENFDVLDYGAIGDGIADDTKAFSRAWKAVCRSTEGTPTLLVPEGKTFLLSPIAFHGPCKSPCVHVEVLSNIIAPDNIEAWINCEEHSWLFFKDVDNLVIHGTAQINGRGSIWWNSFPTAEFDDDNDDEEFDNARNYTDNSINIKKGHNNCKKPTALRFRNCNGLHLHGLQHLDPPRNHISICGSSDCNLSNLQILAPQGSPNTDGIDISTSNQVHISDSFIATGDDCIAINSGTISVNITGVYCGPGHGISVGSLGAKGSTAEAQDIYVQNCTMNGTSNGVRIKTWQGGSGYAKGILFEDITLINVKHPIIIDQYYCPHHLCARKPSAVAVSDVTYRSIQGTSATKVAITLNCSDSVACTNVVMENITITSSLEGQETTAVCKDVQGTSNAVTPSVPCLSQT